MIETVIIVACAAFLGGTLGAIHRRVRNIEKLLRSQAGARIPAQRGGQP